MPSGADKARQELFVMPNGFIQEVLMPEEADKVVGYDGAERITGICVGTLYSLVAHKEIPHYRISKRLVRFRVCELRSWMDSRREA